MCCGEAANEALFRFLSFLSHVTLFRAEWEKIQKGINVIRVRGSVTFVNGPCAVLLGTQDFVRSVGRLTDEVFGSAAAGVVLS